MSCLVVLVALASVSGGCATTYKDFKRSDVRPGEGVAIGHVRVQYNGKPYTKECSVCFNSANGPCQKLTSEGLVFQPLPTGTASLRRIACLDGSLHHHSIDDASFVQPLGVVYFGDVTIDWVNEGGLKATAMFGLIGAAIDESREDGSIDVDVDTDDAQRVVQAYREQVRDPSAKVYSSPAR